MPRWCVPVACQSCWQASWSRRHQSAHDTGRGDGGLTTAGREELNRLRRESHRLKLERQIPLKGGRLVRSGDEYDPIEEFRFVSDRQVGYPTARMCWLLDVSCRGYNALMTSPPVFARSAPTQPSFVGPLVHRLRGPSALRAIPSSNGKVSTEPGQVWATPPRKGKCSIGCRHMSGLFDAACMPLALTRSADRVSINPRAPSSARFSGCTNPRSRPFMHQLLFSPATVAAALSRRR